MQFKEILKSQEDKIEEMSIIASSIVKEHFDPLIGAEQNDYMINKFQTVDSIKEQLENGYRYFLIIDNDVCVGFIAFYPKGKAMYLSKFYLHKDKRGKGYAHQMLEFVIREAKYLDCQSIELNVNKKNSACLAYEKLGFQIIRSEKNDIVNGVKYTRENGQIVKSVA